MCDDHEFRGTEHLYDVDGERFYCRECGATGHVDEMDDSRACPACGSYDIEEDHDGLQHRFYGSVYLK